MTDHTDLIARLRCMPRYAHDDKSIGDEAADAIEQLQVDVERLRDDAARYRWIAAHCRSTTEHWGGRWSIVVEGPPPAVHDAEDAFDAAIDAAMRSIR